MVELGVSFNKIKYKTLEKCWKQSLAFWGNTSPW